MTPLSLPLIAVCFFLGCTASVPVPGGASMAITITPDDPCGGQSLQGFVGQDQSAVQATTLQGVGPIRVIGPDDMVTMDFNPQRINFRTDASGTIVAVDCG